MDGKKDNSILTKVLVGIFIFLMGVLCSFAYFKFNDGKETKEIDTSEKDTDSGVRSKDKSSDDSKVDVNVDNGETVTNDSSTSDNTNTKQLYTEEFVNQNGEKVKITAEKIVSATGYSGSSNYKFFLRDGNLYYMNISSDKKEVLLATSVKDLYLEQDEICAQLNSDGKVVNQDIHVIYK